VVFVAATTAASVLLLVAIWIVPVVPTNDGPQHVYAAHISSHFDNPTAEYWKYYELATPVTSIAFSAMFSSLEVVLGWRRALAASLSIIVLTWAWGFQALVLAIDRRRWALGLLGFATALNWSFYMGFWNFVLAVGLGFATLAVAIRRADWTPVDRVAIAALLLVGALAHVVATALTAVVLTVVVLLRTPRQRLARNLGLLVVMGAPAAIIAALASRAGGVATAAGAADASATWLGFGERLTLVGACLVGGPTWRAWGILGFAGLGAYDVAVRARRREAARPELALAVAAGLMLAATLSTPFHLPLWQFFSPRFLPFAVLGAVSLVAVELLSRRVAVALFGAVAAYTTASIGWSIHYHRALAASAADALAGIDEPIRQIGPRLPIVLEPLARRSGLSDGPLPYTEPLRNIGQLYATEQGGVVPYTFTLAPQLHELVSRPNALPPAPDRTFWKAFLPGSGASDQELRAIIAHLAAHGAAFDDVIVIARPWVLDELTARGYETDWRRGDAMIAHFRGCPLDLVVRDAEPGKLAEPSAPGALLTAGYGWVPLLEPFWATQVPVHGSDDVVLGLPRAPCGDVWVRAAEGPRMCRGADREGRLAARVDRSTRLVVCTLEARP